MIMSKPVFVLCPLCCVLSGEATNTNFIVNGLTRLGLEPTIYRTRNKHANHYTNDVVILYMYLISWKYFIVDTVEI